MGSQNKFQHTTYIRVYVGFISNYSTMWYNPNYFLEYDDFTMWYAGNEITNRMQEVSAFIITQKKIAQMTGAICH